MERQIMIAAQFAQYGPPEVIEIKNTVTPTPKDNEVLVQIHATTVTPVDCSFRAGAPCIVRLYLGLRRPNKTILGTELAGVVIALGKDVTRFGVGDRIFAAPADGTGAHAEYICLPEDGALASIPSNMSFEQAATICNGGLTALPFLRDHGKIKRGDKVLIIGASGSIGTIAVQLAKYFGAHVTGVCSTANVDMVKSLGVDQVIDYTVDDFTKHGETYDIIFDTVAKSSFGHAKRSLTRRGVYLVTAPSFATVFRMLWASVFGGKRAVMAATGLRPAREQVKDMEFLKGLFETGSFKTIIDRIYPFGHITNAHSYVEKGHKKGNVVIAVKPQ